MPMPGNQQVAALPRAAVGTRIIMRPGEDGGVITQSEYLIAELASTERLTKKCTNNIIAMLKRKDFVPDEIRTDRIQQIEKLISKADGGSTLVFDLWMEGDGTQELKLYLRKLVPIMECLISDERFAGHQYLSFELRERDGFRMFGPANGSLWWQINQESVGSDRVLLGLVTFIDESYNKKNLSCESIYGERHTCEILMMTKVQSKDCSAPPVTLMNIDESKRFKKGAYRFCGCIPKFDNAAAKAGGRSDDWIKCRSAEVHRSAMRHVADQILRNSEHRLEMWVGRIELLFSIDIYNIYEEHE